MVSASSYLQRQEASLSARWRYMLGSKQAEIVSDKGLRPGTSQSVGMEDLRLYGSVGLG